MNQLYFDYFFFAKFAASIYFSSEQKDEKIFLLAPRPTPCPTSTKFIPDSYKSFEIKDVSKSVKL